MVSKAIGKIADIELRDFDLIDKSQKTCLIYVT
jgi:hypothetical protein